MSTPYTKHSQYTLEITTSALCNLACTYCFEGEKVNKQRLDGKIEKVKQRIYELLASDWFNERYHSLNISFWGGEPTLNDGLIIDVMNEFHHVPNLNFHMYTNGYDRHRIDRILDSVNTEKLNVQISYDGKDINDKFRLTATGKTTSAQVVENIEYFARKGINLSLKATVPTGTMSGLYRVWKEFKHLHDQLNGINKNTRVRYSPTIDYVNDIPDGDLQPLIDAFRSEMLLIAREEIAFVKEHGYHLMTWFAAGDSKQHCTAGEHMQVIDVDGQVYTCHGSLYSPNKEDMTSGSIEDDSFVENIAAATDKYHQHTRELSPICTGCVATTCMVCPVASYDKSTHETFEDRWTDRWVGNLCGFFKTFGEIDRTVQSHLQGVLSTSTTGDN